MRISLERQRTSTCGALACVAFLAFTLLPGSGAADPVTAGASGPVLQLSLTLPSSSAGQTFSFTVNPQDIHNGGARSMVESMLPSPFEPGGWLKFSAALSSLDGSPLAGCCAVGQPFAVGGVISTVDASGRVSLDGQRVQGTGQILWNSSTTSARIDSVSTEAVPEPATMVLFGLGAAGLAAGRAALAGLKPRR